MNIKNITVTFLSSLLLINCTSLASTESLQRGVASEKGWSGCYNEQENKVYFMTDRDSSKCHSPTFYSGPKGFVMNDSSLTDDGAIHHRSDDPQQKTLKDGSLIFASTWNNFSKADDLIVLKVDLKKHKVSELCRYTNHSARYDLKLKDGHLYVTIRVPKSPTSDSFVVKSVRCGQ